MVGGVKSHRECDLSKVGTSQLRGESQGSTRSGAQNTLPHSKFAFANLLLSKRVFDSLVPSCVRCISSDSESASETDK